jgi:hypothetical protein
MATRPFSMSYPAQVGDRTFPVPAVPLSALTVTIGGVARAFTMLDTSTVLLTVALAAPGVVVISGTTATSPDEAVAGGAAITSFAVGTGGTSSDSLAAFTSVTSVTDNSGGTSGVNTIAAVTDVATAANAIATLAAKVNTLAVNNGIIRNSITSLGNKVNTILTRLRAAKILLP